MDATISPLDLGRLNLVGSLIDAISNGHDSKNLERLLEVGEGIPDDDYCRSGERPVDHSESLSKDARMGQRQFSAAELESKLRSMKAEGLDIISSLSRSYFELSRSSCDALWYPTDRAIVLKHYENLVSWLQGSRTYLMELDKQRVALQKEISVGKPSPWAELEKRARKLWDTLDKIEGYSAQKQMSKATLSSMLPLFESMLQGLRETKWQSGALRSHSMPPVVQDENHDLTVRLAKMQSSLQDLQARQRNCDAEIGMLQVAIEIAQANTTIEPSTPPQSILPISDIETHLKFAIHAIVHAAIGEMSREFLKKICEDLPPGNRNPNQQYAWRLLQKTFLVLDAETETESFQRDDPDLSGPKFFALYSM